MINAPTISSRFINSPDPYVECPFPGGGRVLSAAMDRREGEQLSDSPSLVC
jgi:hypothetical protein